MKIDKPIYISQPCLSPLDDYIPYFKSIWDTGIMTHNGPYVQELEKELAVYFKARNVICVSNCTSALQLSLKALKISGEVITTPFSFIATSNSINWENCTPVFVDICEDTWNLDPDKIKDKITEKTSCIMPVHVFGAPCNIPAIKSIATLHGLKVIYDAAHAFGVDIAGHSITGEGDVCCLSFHATKIFNSAEGGACITENDDLAKEIREMRFFGFNLGREIVNSGINAKMTEIHAAIGLVNLKHFCKTMALRKEKYLLYSELLKNCPLRFQHYKATEYNYSYMPVVLENEKILIKLIKRLNDNNVFPKRYFYPSLNTLKIYHPAEILPVSERISKTILCLPLYDTLSDEDIQRISKIITVSL